MKNVLFLVSTIFSISVFSKVAVPTTIYCDIINIKEYKLTTEKSVIFEHPNVGFKVNGYLDQFGIPTVQMINVFETTYGKQKASSKMWVLPVGVTNIFSTLDDDNHNEEAPNGSVTCSTSKKELLNRRKLLESIDKANGN